MRTDYFALLHEPRQPWLDPDALKEKFFHLSAEVHPDRVHQAAEADKLAAHRRYTELNAAYLCLREPRARVRHLLELELGQKPSDLTQVPDDLMEQFFQVGKLVRDVDAFLAEKSRAASPLLRAELFERGQAWVEKLAEQQRALAARREPLVNELKSLAPGWESNVAKPLDRLLEIWRLLSFYERWLAQIQERLASLSF